MEISNIDKILDNDIVLKIEKMTHKTAFKLLYMRIMYTMLLFPFGCLFLVSLIVGVSDLYVPSGVALALVFYILWKTNRLFKSYHKV